MAITNEAKIRVVIDGKDAEVSVKDLGKSIEASMKRGQKEAVKLESNFKKIGDAAQRFYFSFQSLRIFVNGAMDFIRASNQQELAVAGFEQAMRSMGRYTETFSKQLRDLASQIQSEGVIGDEAILEGAKFLATYKDISNDVMPRTMRIMADLAALMGGDMRSAANMLGKASMGMVGELRRAGITISEATMKSKDFSSILKEIEEQVGGQNRALANTAAGGMKQFANAWGDLKEVIGDVLKNFMIPFTNLMKPIAEWLRNVNRDILTLVTAVGLTTAALWKLSPAITNLGIVSKAALGWIGLILAALEALYIGYRTNAYGMKDALDYMWDVMVAFYNSTMGWAQKLTKVFDLINNVFQLMKRGMLPGPALVAAIFALGKELDVQFKATEKKIKTNVDAFKLNLQPDFEAAGEDLAKSLTKGMEKSITKEAPSRIKKWLDFMEGGAGIKTDYPLPDLSQPKVRSRFEEYMDMFNSMGDLAQNTFEAIGSSFMAMSDTMTRALFNTKTKFKDLWQAMAMDFTRIFISHILADLAKVFAMNLFSSILPNLIVPGAGAIVPALTMAGGISVASAGNNGQLISAISGLRSDINKLSMNATVINRIGSAQLYEAVKSGREADLIRRGKDINNNLF